MRGASCEQTDKHGGIVLVGRSFRFWPVFVFRLGFGFFVGLVIQQSVSAQGIIRPAESPHCSVVHQETFSTPSITQGMDRQIIPEITPDNTADHATVITEEEIFEALREPLDFAVAFYQDRLRDGGRGLEI
jgi:hypothetical protein